MLLDIDRGLATGWSRNDDKLQKANDWFNAVVGFRDYQKEATGMLPTWKEAQDFVYRWRTETDITDEDIETTRQMQELDYATYG